MSDKSAPEKSKKQGLRNLIGKRKEPSGLATPTEEKNLNHITKKLKSNEREHEINKKESEKSFIKLEFNRKSVKQPESIQN